MTRFYMKFYTAAEVRELEEKARQEGYRIADVRRFQSFTTGFLAGVTVGVTMITAILIVSLQEGTRLVVVQEEAE